MQRFYALFSATLLTAFIALLAYKASFESIESESVKIEEADLEELQDDETEEIQFELKDLNQFSGENQHLTQERTILVDYHFAIKSNSQKVSSPPPEA